MEYRAAAEALVPMSQSHQREGVTLNKPKHLWTWCWHLDQQWGRSNHLGTDPCSSKLLEEHGCSTAWDGAELYEGTLPNKKNFPEGYGERHEHIWS